MELKQELLVEGNDDLHVVAALCNKHNIKENFRIVDCKGIENLLIGLPVRLKSSVKTIGAVIDADADLNARWNSVCSILSALGRYGDIPDECPAEGLILEPVSEGDPKFGLWIMPDNRTSGMLEHFTTMLIPADDDLLPVVDETLSRLESNGMNRYSTVHHEKARIHTWLAWQESPGTPMGLAITKKYLTSQPSAYGAFTEWLKSLFEDA